MTEPGSWWSAYSMTNGQALTLVLALVALYAAWAVLIEALTDRVYEWLENHAKGATITIITQDNDNA